MNLITDLESQLSETTQNKNLLTLLIQTYNDYAVNLLEEKKPLQALEILQKAESFPNIPSSLRSKTYNNIACCYKLQGKYSLSLKFLQKALFIHPTGEVHLNLCAVHSIEGKHQRALEEAMYATIYLQDEFIEKLLKSEDYINKCESLAVAYHNLAVELEHLKRFPESIGFYSKALSVCDKMLPEDSPLKPKLEEDMQKALKSATKTGRRQETYNKKKRMIIKGSHSRSPIMKGQAGSNAIFEGKEIVTALKNKGRKFVSSGVSKAKMIDLRKTLPGGFIEGPEEIKAQTTRVKLEVSEENREDELPPGNFCLPEEEKVEENENEWKTSKKHSRVEERMERTVSYMVFSRSEKEFGGSVENKEVPIDFNKKFITGNTRKKSIGLKGEEFCEDQIEIPLSQSTRLANLDYPQTEIQKTELIEKTESYSRAIKQITEIVIIEGSNLVNSSGVTNKIELEKEKKSLVQTSFAVLSSDMQNENEISPFIVQCEAIIKPAVDVLTCFKESNKELKISDIIERVELCTDEKTSNDILIITKQDLQFNNKIHIKPHKSATKPNGDNTNPTLRKKIFKSAESLSKPSPDKKQRKSIDNTNIFARKDRQKSLTKTKEPSLPPPTNNPSVPEALKPQEEKKSNSTTDNLASRVTILHPNPPEPAIPKTPQPLSRTSTTPLDSSLSSQPIISLSVHDSLGSHPKISHSSSTPLFSN